MAQEADRPILITGGTGGLGRAVVGRLLADHSCVVLYRSVKAWTALQQAVGPTERLYGVEADLSDEAAVQRAVSEARAHVGPLYGLVHLAGGFLAGGSVEETTTDTWNRLLQHNLTNAFVTMRAVLPQLRARGAGRIVAVGSSATLTQPAGIAGYVVAKAGLHVLTDVLAKELKGTGITVNIVLPGSMATPPMLQEMSRDKLVPLHRVAETIAFLLSDAAGSITGAGIPITVPGSTE